jgi:cation transport regulator ChaB
VQRGRDQHERRGDLEVLREGNAHGLAQEAVVMRESKGWSTRC